MAGLILYGMVLAVFFPALEHDFQQRILKHWTRRVLGVLQLGVEMYGSLNPAGMHGCLLVANHVSWLDVLALNAIAPACFVAKSEVRSWPLLGWLSHRAGTLFIKRGIRRDTVRANREISRLLRQGKRVALFPEGTSTDGELPGHFHASLLQGAIDIGCAVCPVAIRYHDGSGKASSDGAFVGDMSFIQSLWKILCSPSLHVDLLYLPPVSSAGKDRRLLASQAYGDIHMALAMFSPGYTVCVPDAAMHPGWRGFASPVRV